MQIHTSSRHFLALGVLLCTVVGCGGRKVYPVQGKVVFADGSIMTGGWVVFEPLEAGKQVSAIGDIQGDGTFVLSTDGKSDGAMEGWYKITVHPPLTNNPDENAKVEVVVHRKYLAATTTPLQREVKADRKANQFTLELEKP